MFRSMPIPRRFNFRKKDRYGYVASYADSDSIHVSY
jgi:hypothetical protein